MPSSIYFGLFTQLITYKCDWYHRKLILVNHFYPSMQRCTYCVMINLFVTKNVFKLNSLKTFAYKKKGVKMVAGKQYDTNVIAIGSIGYLHWCHLATYLFSFRW